MVISIGIGVSFRKCTVGLLTVSNCGECQFYILVPLLLFAIPTRSMSKDAFFVPSRGIWSEVNFGPIMKICTSKENNE